MTGTVPFAAKIELIARAIHDEYLARFSFDPERNPMAVPWEYLSEEFKESNRNQARDILRKLRTFTLGIAPVASGLAPAEMAFTSEQVDRLARMEHDRWRAEKQRNGWLPGVDRNNDRKIHPDLVPWDALSDEAKEKDRNSIRAIPRVLARAGYTIVSDP